MSVTHAVVIATRPAFEAGQELSAALVAGIRQSLETLAKLGVRDVAVVDGRHAVELRERLALHELPQLTVEVIANLSWRNLSGSAVLLASSWIERAERCLIVRGDRPPELESLRLLTQLERAKSDAVL